MENQEISPNTELKPGKYRRVPVIVAVIILIAVGALWYRDYVQQTDTGDEIQLITYVDRGTSPERREEIEIQIQTVEAAMEQDPEMAGNISEILKLGNLYYRLGDLAGARDQYEKILSISATDAPAHENLAQTLYEMHDYEGAEQHWRSAIEYNPYEVIYIKLADCLAEHKSDDQEAIRDLLEEGIATLGQTPGLLSRLGMWYAENGMYEEAISHYKVAQQLDPNDQSIEILMEEAREMWRE